MNKVEVPFMTSDIYYKFESPLMERQLSLPEKPERNKTYRPDYKIRDDGLGIMNGPNLFNRPLYTPGCRTFVTAGDRPAFILWGNNNYKKADKVNWGIPDAFGYCYMGLQAAEQSKWLHEFEMCETLYHPGWVEYHLIDEAFPGLAVHIELVPHCSGAVFIHFAINTINTINAINDINDINKSGNNVIVPEIIWTHGCITYEGINCYMSSYDPQSRLIPWEQPDFASNDSVEFADGTAVLRDSGDAANWVAVGTFPVSSEFFAADAEKQLKVKPADIFEHPGKDKPVAAGRVQLNENACGDYEACIVLNWGRDCDPLTTMKHLVDQWRKYLKSGLDYFSTRCGSITINTPDKELDTVFRFNAVASDSMWHSPGINHGAYSWGGLTTIFRTFYGLTCCGDHDRIKSALNFHCALDQDGKLLNLAGSVEEEPRSAIYESYGSTVDMLWHHYLWSGDQETLVKWAPIIDQLLEHEENNQRDSSGLFIDHLSFWCSDSFEYENGCAVGTAMVWLMYTIRGRIAGVLGEDPLPFFKRADEIRKIMYSRLWNEDGGFFFDTVFNNGEVVPSTIAPAIYHPIEFGMVEEEKAERMLAYMLQRLTSPEGMVRIDDWFPINWSHNVYSPLETANSAIAAYILRKRAVGYKMLRGVIKGAIYKAVVPGSISCQSSSTGITKNGTDFGDGVSLFLRSVVEGLFGIHMNLPEESISISPNFPDEWDKAEISIPDLKVFKYCKESSEGNGSIEIRLVLRVPLKVRLSLPVKGKIRYAAVNDIQWKYETSYRNKETFLNLELDMSSEYLVKVEFDAEDTGCNDIANLEEASTDLQNDIKLEKDVIVYKEDISSKDLSYEYVNLDSLVKIPFSDIWKAYPQELNWHLYNFGKGWWCEFDAIGCNETILHTEDGIPFKVDGGNVTVVRKKHDTKIWKGRVLDIDIPAMLKISISRPAEKIYLLLSGLCSPMTCYLPQVMIELVYEETNVVFNLSSPDEFDFISQHTSCHPAVHIGWFGTDDDLIKMKNDKGEACPDYEPLNSNGVQQLHADVICLEAGKGILKEIIIKPLRNQSGVILHGITLGLSVY